MGWQGEQNPDQEGPFSLRKGFGWILSWRGLGGRAGVGGGSQKGRNVLKFAHLMDDFGFSVAGDLEGGETRRRGTH